MSLDTPHINYGVHDFQGKSRSREQYHQLVRAAGDTRHRIHNVHPDHGGTFNSLTRSMSYGSPGDNPKGEPAGPHGTTRPRHVVDHAWPQAVLGGFGHSYQGHGGLVIETKRKTGSLERQISNDASIKDDRFVYYGNGGKHYGVHSCSHNRKHYDPKPAANVKHCYHTKDTKAPPM